MPPAAGDRWHFNVFRIKRPNGPAEPERDAVYAAWSTPAGPSFHEPAAFRVMEFAPAAVRRRSRGSRRIRPGAPGRATI